MQDNQIENIDDHLSKSINKISTGCKFGFQSISIQILVSNNLIENLDDNWSKWIKKISIDCEF